MDAFSLLFDIYNAIFSLFFLYLFNIGLSFYVARHRFDAERHGVSVALYLICLYGFCPVAPAVYAAHSGMFSVDEDIGIL